MQRFGSANNGSRTSTDSLHELSSVNSGRPNLTALARKVVLGHGASGNAVSMKPYVVGFKRRGIDAMAVDLPRGVAERAVPVFIKASGRGPQVIGGGQSFGGRVASMAAIEADFGGLVLFSYPLHRPGFTDQLRTEHFPLIRCDSAVPSRGTAPGCTGSTSGGRCASGAGAWWSTCAARPSRG